MESAGLNYNTKLSLLVPQYIFKHRSCV